MTSGPVVVQVLEGEDAVAAQPRSDGRDQPGQRRPKARSARPTPNRSRPIRSTARTATRMPRSRSTSSSSPKRSSAELLASTRGPSLHRAKRATVRPAEATVPRTARLLPTGRRAHSWRPSVVSGRLRHSARRPSGGGGGGRRRLFVLRRVGFFDRTLEIAGIELRIPGQLELRCFRMPVTRYQANDRPRPVRPAASGRLFGNAAKRQRDRVAASRPAPAFRGSSCHVFHSPSAEMATAITAMISPSVSQRSRLRPFVRGSRSSLYKLASAWPDKAYVRPPAPVRQGARRHRPARSALWPGRGSRRYPVPRSRDGRCSPPCVSPASSARWWVSRPSIFGQQRGVDVDDPPAPARDECWRQDPHVAGQRDRPDAVVFEAPRRASRQIPRAQRCGPRTPRSEGRRRAPRRAPAPCGLFDATSTIS